MEKFARALAASALLFSTPVAATEQRPTAKPELGINAETQLISDAVQKLRDNDIADSEMLFKTAVSAPAFAELSPSTQHWCFFLLGSIMQKTGEKEAALEYAKKSTAMQEAEGVDWSLLLSTSRDVGDVPQETDAMITIATRWPLTLNQYPDEYFTKIIDDLDDLHDEDRSSRLLEALFAANWQPVDKIDDISYLWLDLTRYRVERGDIPGAKASAELITDPISGVVMNADKRFDAVIAADHDRYDPRRMAERRLAALRSISDADPSKLEGPVHIALILILLERPEEALALLDAALKKSSQAGSSTAYSDEETHLKWAMDTRERALARLGRHDEAVSQERDAAQLIENGHQNVSQLLNLGGEYLRLGRGSDALQVVNAMQGRQMSRYGEMVMEHVRACASAQVGDEEGVNAGLDYLRKHREDSPAMLRNGLLCSDHEDELASLIISDLHDKAHRSGALLQLQDFDPTPERTAYEKLLDDRLQKVKSRPDIQAAIAEIGYIRQVKLMR